MALKLTHEHQVLVRATVETKLIKDNLAGLQRITSKLFGVGVQRISEVCTDEANCEQEVINDEEISSDEQET